MGIEVIFFIVILIISVVIHEVAHGYMAYALGDPTAKIAGRLTLNPLPHIDPVGSVMVPLLLSLIPGGLMFGWAKPVPFNPYNLKAGKWGPALVAVAGPVSNLIIATFFGLAIRFNEFLPTASGPVLQLLSTVVVMNIVLAVFNLVPIPPLDGSKILFALIPYKWRQIERMLERYQLVLLLLVILFVGMVLSPIVSIIYLLLTGVGI